VPFDPAKWPNAVRISTLLERGWRLGVHCNSCAHFALLDPATVPLPPETFVPALEGRFKCTRCGSRATEARPEYPR
jgi:hypothetical protein